MFDKIDPNIPYLHFCVWNNKVQASHHSQGHYNIRVINDCKIVRIIKVTYMDIDGVKLQEMQPSV